MICFIAAKSRTEGTDLFTVLLTACIQFPGGVRIDRGDRGEDSLLRAVIHNQRISTLRTERRQLLNELDDDSILSGLRRLNNILAELEEPLTEMDENLLSQIVQTITVPDDNHISFHLIGGLTLTEATNYNRRCRRV